MSDKGRKLYNGITNIDDDIIMAALAARPQAGAPVKKKRSKMYYVYRWGGLAAAVVSLAVVGILVIPQMLNGSKSDDAQSAYTSTSNSTTTADVAGDSDYYYDSVAEATSDSDSYKDKENDAAASEGVYDWNNADSGECTELEDNQIMLGLEVADVKTIVVSYPGYDSIVIDDDIADKLIDLINGIGILTEKDDYLDVTEEDYATISIEMIDGQYLEITPKYPYILIDGVPYQGPSKDKAIYNLALYLNDIVKLLFE